ncbi:MAG: DUF4214 domain-containing protein [Thermoanaerobaculum sp.]|nr:DUF4214 domain-containing protein [Thermoanaerobaculum sp.]
MLRALIVLVLSTPVTAQPTQWAKPYVAGARLLVQEAGERLPRPLAVGRELEVEAGSELIVQLEPLDQWGRSFPADLATFLVADSRSCATLVTIAPISSTSFSLKAAASRGRCSLRLVAAGNLNLEWNLPVTVTSLAKGGYSRREAEFIVTRLYRALLAREPDPEGFRSAVAEVQRNRLGSLLEGMLHSPEFKEKWQGHTPVSFLEQVYQGLLGRPPDSEGVRRYLREVERGRLKGVLADILRSAEFEQLMLQQTRTAP